MTLASVVALVLSLGGNVFQWMKDNADLVKAKAEVASLEQARMEGSSRSMQSWIDELKNFDAVEDRVMVLSAALATSPYDDVKAWARKEVVRLEAQLAQRRATAEQDLAMAESNRSSPITPPVPRGAHPSPTARSQPDAGEAVPPPSTGTDVAAVARRDLARVTLAQELLRKAKQMPSPASAPSR